MSGRALRSVMPQLSAGRRERLRTYARGRVCAADGCATILSAYNAADRCALHGTASPPRSHHQHARPLSERPCAECGHLFASGNPKRIYCNAACRCAAFAHRGVAAERD